MKNRLTFVIEAKNHDGMWTPAITGLLNQTSKSDLEASTFSDIAEIVEVSESFFKNSDTDKIRIVMHSKGRAYEYTTHEILRLFTSTKEKPPQGGG